jgi:hypothetical protein
MTEQSVQTPDAVRYSIIEESCLEFALRSQLDPESVKSDRLLN